MGRMNHQPPSGRSSGESEFDRLLRSVLGQSTGAFHRPSEESITAYLLGVATEPERREVQSALAASPEFRLEMLEAGRELDRLEAQDVDAEMESVAAPAAPALHEFLARHSAGRDQVPRAPSPAIGWLEAVRAFLSASFTRRWGIGIGAAATSMILVAVLLRGAQPPFVASSGELVSPRWEVRNDVFAPTLLRSGGPPPAVAEDTEREAALASFRSVLAFQNGRFALGSDGSSGGSDHEPRTLILRVMDREGRSLARFTAGIPSSAAEPAAVLFLLRAGTPKPYLLPMRADSGLVVWKGSKPDSGAVTFVYGLGRQYGASKAMPFRFR